MAQPIGLLLTGLYKLIGNYGISIVIVTLIIKLVLYPLYKKQIMSTAGISELQPQLEEIKRKYADDKEMMNAKISELYQQEKVTPTAGCVPMIVQMFIIFGLFALLRNPITYLGDSSEMLFAVHESFLWISDLSQPDRWILPIAAGIATYFSFSMTQGQSGASSSQAMMKSMKYIFPVMIVLLARSYPAGLAIYWAISQAVQILYNLRFAKLRKNMAAKKKKGKKKGGHK